MLDRIFGKLNMTWAKTVLFAVATGVYTGLVMCIPALKNTSFQDIGATYEWWVFFAVIVIVNCQKNYEAALKCFVFFLISQPLVYLVEVALGQLSIDFAIMYYKNWLIPTILTLPGGFIAFYCKKENVLGAVILGLGNAIELLMGIFFLGEAITNFPCHLLTSLCCIAFVIIMTLSIQKKGKLRAIAFIVPVVITAIGVIVLKTLGLFVSNIFF